MINAFIGELTNQHAFTEAHRKAIVEGIRKRRTNKIKTAELPIQ